MEGWGKGVEGHKVEGGEVIPWGGRQAEGVERHGLEGWGRNTDGVVTVSGRGS